MKPYQTILMTIALVALATVAASAQMELKPAAGVTYTDYSKDPATGEFK